MLKELYIKDFAIIDEIQIDFSEGLNVLTGETGAGKSILIDAVGLLLGERSRNEFIRTECEKAQIKGVFDTKGDSNIVELLKSIGITPEEDDTLILQREITTSGKNTCLINGKTVVLSNLRGIGRLLIDVHGQHSHHSLLEEEKQLQLLDKYGGKQLLKLKADVKELYNEISSIDKELAKLKGSLGKENDLDYLKFQLQEINEAQLTVGEDAELINEKNRAEGAQELLSGCEKIHSQLYSETDSAYDKVGECIAVINDLLKYDSNLENKINEMHEVLYLIEEISRNIVRYKEGLEFDPDYLNEIYKRLDLINKLKSKYGNSIEEILEYQQKIVQAIEDIEKNEEEAHYLEEKLTHLRDEYEKKASELSLEREKAAEELQEKIKENLKELAMPHSDFKITVEPINYRSPTGTDKVQFIFTANPDEKMKPLKKVMSGGEMSRVMLAVKTILIEVDDVPTIIFDEIDTGVGGESIKSVAQKLSFLGEAFQVICVTHSYNIAALAKNHLNVSKTVENGKTIVKIKKVIGEEKVKEIARMLGKTKGAEDHARLLIQKSK